MKWTIYAALAAILVTTPVSAGTIQAIAGQPFCLKQGDLLEALQASVSDSKEWIASIIKQNDCIFLKGDVQIGVIEDIPSNSEVAHTAKVRIMRKGDSFVGYTIILDEKGSK